MMHTNMCKPIYFGDTRQFIPINIQQHCTLNRAITTDSTTSAHKSVQAMDATKSDKL